MSEPLKLLRNAVMSRLRQDTHLARLFPSGTRQALSKVPSRGRHATWLDITEMESRPWRSATFDGVTTHFVVEYALASDKGDRVVAAGDHIRSCLHDCDLPIPGHVLIDIHHSATQICHLPRKMGRGRVAFEALTVTD